VRGSDPDVRVVVLGIRRQEQRLRELFRERAEAEKLARVVLRDLERAERDMKRVEREVRRGR